MGWKLGRRNDKVAQFFQMRQILAIFIAVAIGCALVGCDRAKEEYYNGRSLAQADKSNGQLKVAIVDGAIYDPKIDGTNMMPFWICADILYKRYHIQWVQFSLPDNPQAVREWVRGYNEVMDPEIKARFGTNIFQQTVAEALRIQSNSVARN
jgi:hypothetical protein